MLAGIAISGKAGAGKNHLAWEIAHVLSRENLWVWELGFADGPKEELFRQRGMSKTDVGGRDALVELAQAARSVNENVWIEYAAPRVQFAQTCGLIPIFTDMRFLNELAWVSSRDFLTVRIDASRADRMAALSRRGEDPFFVDTEDSSETQLDEAVFDLRLWNDHSSDWAIATIAANVKDVFTSGAVAA